MVQVKPFKALRPDKKYVAEVAELPYDTMNTEEARKMATGNKNSYLRIDRAEIDLPEGTESDSEEVYKKAAENLNDFIGRGIFIEEDKKRLYIYREVMDEREQIGIVGCVSVDESLEGKIKKHEHTKPDKLKDRIRHIEHCNANTGTILLTYKSDEELEKIIRENMKNEPEYDFKSKDGVSHTVWILSEEETEKVEKAFKNVESLYIADGHHRSKAAEENALRMRRENKEHTGKEEYNYYLAMIAPQESLYVMDYNRVITDLNGLKKDEFLKEVERNFDLEKTDNEFKPSEKYEYGMYIDGNWYRIKYKNSENLKETIEKLDVSVLHDYLIEPILEIKEPQKDSRIDFIGGIRGLKEIERRVDEDMAVGFSLYPTSIEELIEVADTDSIMPAKSTWFEPKVRCGLFLHRL